MNDEDRQKIDWRASEAERRIAALEKQWTPFEVWFLRYCVRVFIVGFILALLFSPFWFFSR